MFRGGSSETHVEPERYRTLTPSEQHEPRESIAPIRRTYGTPACVTTMLGPWSSLSLGKTSVSTTTSVAPQVPSGARRLYSIRGAGIPSTSQTRCMFPVLSIANCVWLGLPAITVESVTGVLH